jgi:hypothetical protein
VPSSTLQITEPQNRTVLRSEKVKGKSRVEGYLLHLVHYKIYHAMPRATIMVLPKLAPSLVISLFVGVGVGVDNDAVLEVLLTAMTDASEETIAVAVTSFLTMPALVNASPFKSTTGPDPSAARLPIKVSQCKPGQASVKLAVVA